MHNMNSKLKTFCGVIILTVTLLACSGTSNSTSKKNTWTLMVCESMHYSGGCQTNAFTNSGYATASACRAEGNHQMTLGYPGFECGYNCEYDYDWGALVCDKFS